MNFNYKRENLVKIIKARRRKDYKFLFNEAIEMIISLNGEFQELKNYDFDEGVADFISCSNTNECDDLLKK